MLAAREPAPGAPPGNSGADFELRLDCVDESLSLRNGVMSRGPVTRSFGPGDGWVATGGDFVKEQTVNIAVDPNARGHMLRHVATLVSVNGAIVSFIESTSSSWSRAPATPGHRRGRHGGVALPGLRPASPLRDRSRRRRLAALAARPRHRGDDPAG
jgi:hypothetical protein